MLGTGSALLVTLAMMITTDILRTAPTVAQNLGEAQFYGAWLLGGLVSLAGAWCYAEMASAFPHPGGDYHFLHRAYGARLAFIYAWSRFTVMHPGWIALTAFLFADHLQALLPLGAHGTGLYAGALVLALVAVNLAGLRVGLLTQTTLVLLVALGFAAIVAAGLTLAPRGEPPLAVPVASTNAEASTATAMIYVFLALGGWSDSVSLATELRDRRRGMLLALLGALAALLLIYLAVNWAFIHGLGYAGLAASAAPAVELLTRAFGSGAAWLIVLVVGVAAVSSINAVLIAAPRATYAAARDLQRLPSLAYWDERRRIPTGALLAVGGLALLLVLAGSRARSGFAAMVEYITPVYWLFLALSSAALLVLRWREPDAPRPVRVPLYPLLPLLFCAVCLVMLASSLAYLGAGAWLGLLLPLSGFGLHAGLRRRATTKSSLLKP